jgi:hypothetical protein
MPTPHSKTRQALKSRFGRGALPTEADFSNLIDAGLNQAEDGVSKRPNQPLSLVRQKPDQPVLRLFEEPTAVSCAWQIQLAAEGKAGFAITNTAGQACLFIDQKTGHVGLGTASPTAQLTVHSDLSSTDTVRDPESLLKHRGPVAIKSPIPQLDFIDTDTAIDWTIHVNDNRLYFVRSHWQYTDFLLDGNTGHVGIGTVCPEHKLHVYGTAVITTLQADEIQLGGKLLVPQTQSKVAILANGNVGIGERHPAARLTIASDLTVTNTAKDPQSQLSYGGHLAIKAPLPQLDFLAVGGFAGSNDGHWAIRVADGKMSFVRSPWDDRVLVLDGKGNVGIGTAEPRAKLEVAGDMRVEEPVIDNKWQLGGGWMRGKDDWLRVLKPDLQVYDASLGSYYGGFAAKYLWSSEGRIQGSDLRLKQPDSIRPMVNMLPKILGLKPVEFRYKTDPDERNPRFGFIAQEVEEIFPEAVDIGPDGMKGIDEGCLIALLARAIKEQQAEIDLLQAQLSPEP